MGLGSGPGSGAGSGAEVGSALEAAHRVAPLHLGGRHLLVRRGLGEARLRLRPRLLLVRALRHLGARVAQLARHGADEDALGHRVYASDLVATLGISEAEAEEMIFIADLKDADEGADKFIDFTEFKQVVVNWSN